MTSRTPDGVVTARWTREQIRAARLAPLAPLLERRGLQIVETGAGNFRPADFPCLIVKDSYLRWTERGLAGNAIDLLVQVLGRTFQEAMPRTQAATGVTIIGASPATRWAAAVVGLRRQRGLKPYDAIGRNACDGRSATANIRALIVG